MNPQDSLYPLRLQQQQQQQQQQHETEPQLPSRHQAQQPIGIHAMGFDPQLVSVALRKCGGNESRAIEMILGGGAVDVPESGEGIAHHGASQVHDIPYQVEFLRSLISEAARDASRGGRHGGPTCHPNCC